MTNSHFNFIFNGIETLVSANFNGITTAFGDGMLRPKFTISIKTDTGRTRFSYYGSHNDYIKGLRVLDERGILETLDCFFSDASCYDNARDFVDFCNELGYTNISQYPQAKKAYNGCKSHFSAAVRLFGEFYYDTADDVRDQLENQ